MSVCIKIISYKYLRSPTFAGTLKYASQKGLTWNKQKNTIEMDVINTRRDGILFILRYSISVLWKFSFDLTTVDYV